MHKKLGTLSIAVFCYFALHSEIRCMQSDEDYYPFSSEKKSKFTSSHEEMKIHKRSGYWYTNSYRPDMHGGAVFGEDQRMRVENTLKDAWRVHGQLVMDLNGKSFSGTGTLISSRHVLTAGHNLYDPIEKVWATNVNFFPGRCDANQGAKMPVSGVGIAVSHNWKKMRKVTSDFGVVELETEVGNEVGWNGLLACDDDVLKSLPITVAGYPGDKEPNTMWKQDGSISLVKEKQFFYEIGTSEGQSGSNPFYYYEKKNGFYSLGVHCYGSPTENKATRITYSRLYTLVDFINNPDKHLDKE